MGVCESEYQGDEDEGSHVGGWRGTEGEIIYGSRVELRREMVMVMVMGLLGVDAG